MKWFAAGAALGGIIAGVFVALVDSVALIDSWSPEEWTALATWTTAVVAAAAGIVGFGVLREAQRSRREQAQPYVMAYIEASRAGTWIFDLVVRNFGATAAHDVRLEIDPPPRRAIDKDEERTDENVSDEDDEHESSDRVNEDDESVWLPAQIPVLVPGQEWRTLWDTSVARAKSSLPDHHDAEITYHDSQGRAYTVEAALDWRMVRFDVVTVYGEHDAAKALREISKIIGGWKESATGGVRAYVRDGDAKDQRERERMQARRAEREALAQSEEPS